MTPSQLQRAFKLVADPGDATAKYFNSAHFGDEVNNRFIPSAAKLTMEKWELIVTEAKKLGKIRTSAGMSSGTTKMYQLVDC